MENENRCIVCNQPSPDDKICQTCREKANEDLMKHTEWAFSQLFRGPNG